MSRRSRCVFGGLALLIGALGCESAPEFEQTQAGLTTETDALHMLGVSSHLGSIFHTIRYPDGTWDPAGNVEHQTGFIGRIGAMSSAYGDGVLFVAARTDVPGPQWWLARRHAHGAWTPFAQLAGSTKIIDVGMDRANDGRIHFCGSGHFLYHGILSAAGFGGFNQLPIPLPPGGFFKAVDCAAIGGELHYAVATDEAVWTSVRRVDGRWANFERTHTVPEGFVSSLGLEASGDTLHMQLTTRTRQFHAMKGGGGAWSGLGDVEAQAGDPSGPLNQAVNGGAIAAVSGSLHLLQATQGANFNIVVHAIRSPSGGWTGFSRVAAAVPGGFPPGELFDVSLSRSRN
jgi:hypothetical protein